METDRNMVKILTGLGKRLEKTRGYRWARSLRGYRTPNLVPSTSFTIMIVLMYSLFVLGGGIYNIMERPLAITPGPERSWTFYIPYDVNRQTLNESIFVMVFFAMGMAGYFLYYLSTRYVYNPRRAWIMALIGICLLLIGFIGSQHSLNLKVPGS